MKWGTLQVLPKNFMIRIFRRIHLIFPEHEKSITPFDSVLYENPKQNITEGVLIAA
jgi:hypothetical protein